MSPVNRRQWNPGLPQLRRSPRMDSPAGFSLYLKPEGIVCGVCVNLSPSHSLHTANDRAHGGEFFLDALVAAVDVIHAIDDGLSLRDERGQHQRGAGPQVRGDYV